MAVPALPVVHIAWMHPSPLEAPVTTNDVVDRADVVRALRSFMSERDFVAFSLTHYDVGVAMFWWTLRKVFTVLRLDRGWSPNFELLEVPTAARSLCLLEVVFVSSHSAATLWSKQQHVLAQ